MNIVNLEQKEKKKKKDTPLSSNQRAYHDTKHFFGNKQRRLLPIEY